MRHRDIDPFDAVPDRPVRRRPRRPRFDDEPEPARGGRLTEDERHRLARLREDAYTETALPGGADRWSTWDMGGHGPAPHPAWVVTDLGALDTELGLLRTGKEADVHLLRRGLPDGSRECLLAAKRYRGDEHRMFHRDAGYLEGRRVRRSREMRAMRNRSAFGRNLIAEQWATAEFAALSRLWTIGAPVPYPVQRVGTELLLEFVGDADGTAAPRLAELRPTGAELRALWHDLTAALEVLAGEGLCHGDLSPYNVLVHDGRPVLIDLPQVVDVVGNPGGARYLARDVHTIARWFAARGLGDDVLAPGEVLAGLRAAARLP
ncbi:serine protein kinase RIO [Prauserella muralis]|uniref:non-specific serine/threonine protein kinase n=1 Tax=Prauserella muralis TaxID=588067 RepID=A0A2V4AZJ5_9PSEU|nr:RIO1 family regulatory kinase/ATPase [Prauserella muralis]PXY27187.1 kinase [Prauserella muralis]TWE23161.1 RIO kinase 1 [Prauserella muralis]